MLDEEILCNYLSVVMLEGLVRWTWSLAKNRDNKRKHGLSFETAQLVFDDPISLSRVDPFADEGRWQTVGRIDGATVFVVHTWPESDAEEGRIISARKATAHERNAYEERQF